MSDTPRTDAVCRTVYHTAIMDGKIYQATIETVDASFARQLERELAEAQTEVERLALEIENQQYTITCASEENQQLKESMAEARAEIERLKAPALNASLLREKLAELAHDQWAGWMEYLFFKSKQVDGCVVIPAWANERWRRQVATRYADLSEEEKDSDRSEADRVLAVFNAQLAERDKLIEQMRDALQEVMVLCDAVPTRAHDMAKDYHLREIGRIVNVKGLYRVVKAALSAVEKGGNK